MSIYVERYIHTFNIYFFIYLFIYIYLFLYLFTYAQKTQYMRAHMCIYIYNNYSYIYIYIHNVHTICTHNIHIIYVCVYIYAYYINRDVIRREVCRVGFDQRNPKPETRNPKPETRNRLWRLNFPRTDRNPKPETRNQLWRLKFPGPIETRNPKTETRNRQRKWVSIDETRNPKTETWNRQRKWVSSDETRNPKPETRNRQRKLVSIDETRNPKPTAKVGFKRRNPKPETRNRQRKLVSIDETRNPKPETRNPKPTRIRLLGGSPDRNSRRTYTCTFIHVHLRSIYMHICLYAYTYIDIHMHMLHVYHVSLNHINVYINILHIHIHRHRHTYIYIYRIYMYMYNTYSTYTCRLAICLPKTQTPRGKTFSLCLDLMQALSSRPSASWWLRSTYLWSLFGKPQTKNHQSLAIQEQTWRSGDNLAMLATQRDCNLQQWLRTARIPASVSFMAHLAQYGIVTTSSKWEPNENTMIVFRTRQHAGIKNHCAKTAQDCAGFTLHPGLPAEEIFWRSPRCLCLPHLCLTLVGQQLTKLQFHTIWWDLPQWMPRCFCSTEGHPEKTTSFCFRKTTY